MRSLVLCFCLFLIGWPSGQVAAQTGSGVVREIVIEGAQRIEPATVRSYMLIQEGDEFDAGRVDRSMKMLFATGLFTDVAVRREGNTLIVAVVENPVINRVAFEGNKKIKDENLTAEVSVHPRVIYSRSTVISDVKRILTLYRRSGRFAATVEPKIIQLPENRVDLVFEINEGQVTDMERIRFVGNREFSDGRLRGVIRTSETHWYNLFTTDDNYDPDRLTLDRELLRRFYLKKGYADFRVLSANAELTPDREDFFLTFTISEGERYSFGTIDIETRLSGLEPEQIADVVEIEEGDWYAADAVEDTIDDLTEAVDGLGYAFVDVRPRIDRDRENKVINLAFEVSEGARVFVERIDIGGNVRTLDKVIRREFRLVEGDAFNAAKLRRSKQRLQNLDFFEKVIVEQVPGSAPDKTVMKVEVEEKSTGSLSIGAGYSSKNGAVADFGVRERNLLGRGQDLSLKLTMAQRRSEIDLSFTEPFFLDREIVAGFDIFRITTDLQATSSYDSKVTGFSLRAGYPITERLRQGWKYTIKGIDIEHVGSGASKYVQSQQGSRLLSEVSHNLTYDRRDSRMATTEGYFLQLATDLSGLGGDTRYMRNSFSAGKYYPVSDQWVLSFTGTTGYIVGLGENVYLPDRYFIGGDDLRGFANAGVGPRDKTSNDALGSEWMYTGTVELTFPVGLPSELGISGKVFTDIGSAGKVEPSGPDVNDTASVRASLGAGIHWISPFGPVGMDFGFPILKEDFDMTETFRVNFGTRF